MRFRRRGRGRSPASGLQIEERGRQGGEPRHRASWGWPSTHSPRCRSPRADLCRAVALASPRSSIAPLPRSRPSAPFLRSGVTAMLAPISWGRACSSTAGSALACSSSRSAYVLSTRLPSGKHMYSSGKGYPNYMLPVEVGSLEQFLESFKSQPSSLPPKPTMNDSSVEEPPLPPVAPRSVPVPQGAAQLPAHLLLMLTRLLYVLVMVFAALLI